jgi:hypothetical protein
MRTRIRSDAQHHAGRRRHVARRPPDEELVLRLQRTIGNRATTRLLLRKPQVLAKAGLTTDSRVDSKTPGLIQAALEESDELKPFLGGKFPKYAVTKGFEVHTDEDDFNEAVKKMRKNLEPMTKNQKAAAYGKIGGFYDRPSNTVHVRSRTKFGHAVHEGMHKVASSGFHTFWGDFINEGVTQLFADRLLVEHGLGEVTDHEYQDELACAKKLVALTDVKTVAGAYFQNDGALREAVIKHLKTDLLGLTKAVRAGTVCPRLP